MSFLWTHLPTTYLVSTTGIIVIYAVFRLMFLCWPCSVTNGGFLVLTLVSWFAVWSCCRSYRWSSTRILILFPCTVYVFLSVIPSAGLSTSCLAPFPSLRTSTFVFLAAFHSQTLHFISPNKEVIAATLFIRSALRFIEKFWNRERVVKQRRTWYSYQHCAHPVVHITQDCVKRQHHFHLKHTIQ